MNGQALLPDSFEIADDVIYQPVEDEVVLLNLKTQEYYGLDSVGARMWQLLVERGSVAAVADGICEEYEVERDQVLRDVRSMVDDFCAVGLVRAITGP